MAEQLKGQTVFITGAGGVLGATYVRRMLEQGARVIASDLKGNRANALIHRHGRDEGFRFYELDVSNEESCLAIFKKILADNWRPNVVLNNAAITGELLLGSGGTFPDFCDTSVDEFERTLRTNLIGAFMIARQMDRDIIGKWPCKLINVASMYALTGAHHSIYQDMPFKNFSAYSVSKAGIHGLTLWLAGYWATRGATVNTISPGAVLNNHSIEFQRRVGQLTMLDRMCKPDEVADVMLFLASPQSNYMTGQMINVDGGFSAW